MKEIIEPALFAIGFACVALIAIVATMCFCVKLVQWILP